MMTFKDADAALRASGYDDSSQRIGETTQTAKSYEDQVEERATGRPPEHPRMEPAFEHWMKGRETIDVKYAPYPGGARVIYMSYAANGPSPTADEIKTSLEKRYGPGLVKFDIEKWCSPSPCSEKSTALMPSAQTIGLIAPQAPSDTVAIGHRIDAAAAARGGAVKGAF